MKEGVFEIRDDFYLNGRPFKIISGAIHYFRVVPEYWRDRLEKLKAMGARSQENLEKNLTRNVSVQKYAEEILKL